jgi:hypothetical protein
MLRPQQLELDEARTTNIAQIPAGFCCDSAIILQEHPDLIPFARVVQRILERFVVGCDIESLVPLEDRLDQDETWCALIKSVAEAPLKRKLALDIRDNELHLAREQISWILDSKTARACDLYW